jgi:hypothetical protein
MSITQIINGVRSSTSSVNTILKILELTFYSSVLIFSGVILLFNGWRLDPILLFQQILLQIIGMVYVLQQTPPKHNRHTITTVLSQLSDLKVEEGQRINAGDIISDYAVAYAYAIAPPNAPNYKPRSRNYQRLYPTLYYLSTNLNLFPYQSFKLSYNSSRLKLSHYKLS